MRVLSLGVSVTGSEAEGLLAALRSRHPQLVLQLVTLNGEPNARLIELIGTQTAEAIRGHSLLAEKPEVDLLLRMAGTTQISEALKLAGYRRTGKKVLIALGKPRPLLRLLRQAGPSSGRLSVLAAAPLSTRELEAAETAALLNVRRARSSVSA